MNAPLQSPPGRQHGVAAVEFALISVAVFSLLFGILEMARLSFLWNSLTQATNVAARGAATAPFNSSQLVAVRQNAIFAADANAPMPTTNNIHYYNLAIDYLNASRKHVAALPSCQIENLTTCATNPDADSCVRFVRVRLCESMDNASGSCTGVQYQPLMPIGALAGSMNVRMPPFTAIMPLEAQATPGKCN